MSATDTHEGFWPNVAAPTRPAGAIEAGAQPIALEAAPQPMALEAAPTIAALEAGSPEATDTAAIAEPEPVAAEPVVAEPVAAEPEPAVEESTDERAPIALGEPEASPTVEASDAPAVTPLEAAVAAADEHAEALATTAHETPATETPASVTPATDVITDLAAELDDDQRVAMEDVIDLGDFGTDPIDTGVDTAQLHHLPIVESASLGGGNLDAVRAAHPRTLAAHRELEAAVMTGTDSFSEFDRTLIGLIVAIENRSGYWQVHLRRRLERWTTVEEINALAQDWTKAGLAVRERAMLAFAVKLTLVPGQMNEQDAQLLNSVGFDELDLLEIVDVIAYWGFATRVAEGLGVFVEPWMTDDEPV